MDLENFYDYLLVQEGLQKITVEGYRRVLTKFVKEGGHLDKQTIERYIVEMRKKDYSYSHVANTCVAFEKISSFLGNPLKLGRPRKPKQMIKETLTEGEIARMLAACGNSREKAMIAVLAYTGMRNKEVCKLKTSDINIGGGYIRITAGKGSKDRMVYITPECGEMLTMYMVEYKVNGSFLFLTLARGNQYTGWDLRKRLKVISKRAGIRKRVYPHLMRHSFACNLLNRGANVMTIQSLLGHADIRTTMLYAKISPQRVRQEFAFYCPSYI